MFWTLVRLNRQSRAFEEQANGSLICSGLRIVGVLTIRSVGDVDGEIRRNVSR